MADMAMPSSQPNTFRKCTRTYKRIKTNINAKIDIVHITACTVGARLSSKRGASAVAAMLRVEATQTYRRMRVNLKIELSQPM
jgi:hypothetical protein